MTGRFARIPRLTLFSGPQCSLCDVRRFYEAIPTSLADFIVADCQGGACESPPETSVRARDDQHPGGWAGEVETEVCLLDPCSSHRRQRSGERPLERRDGGSSLGRMAEDPTGPFATNEWGQGRPVVEVSSLIFVDPFPEQYWPSQVVCEYDSLSDLSAYSLGEEPEDTNDTRRCFNCGSPSHQLPDCPEPRNHNLIALSRQLFNFHNSSVQSRRIHEVEGAKRQRLEWLESFEPGLIQGPLLREALGLREGDIGEHQLWLRRMADWGYPKGWVGKEDPRLKVWRIIVEEDEMADDVEEQLFEVYGEREEPEELDLAAQPTLLPHLRLPGRQAKSPSSDGGREGSPALTVSSDDSGEVSDAQMASLPIRRWATYPGTYFSSSLLPVYNSSRLPAVVPSHRVSSTFTDDRKTLWQSIIAGPFLPPISRQPSVPPWRLPGAFSGSSDWTISLKLPDLPPPPSDPPPPPLSNPPPPPPSDSPPPLPPSPPSPFSETTPHNVVPTATKSKTPPSIPSSFAVLPIPPPDEDDSMDAIDMDLSDSD